MKRYYCWSGGKDSSASIIVGNEMGLDCDGVIMSEVMFSHKENISGENPKHIEWVYNEAIPIIEKMGYKVIIVKAKKDFLDYFYLVRGERSKYTGKLAGFPLVGRGKCEIKKPLKLRPMQEFFKGVGECEQIVGICADEKERLLSLAGGGQAFGACRKWYSGKIVFRYMPFQKSFIPLLRRRRTAGVLVLSESACMHACETGERATAFMAKNVRAGGNAKPCELQF